jgi:hypothetical protein
VPWLKPTSASARFVEAVARQLRVQEGVERGARLDDAAPALVRIAHRQGEPLPAHRRHAAGLGRVRRDEGGVGQHALPLPADVDQIVAVRAVAVQEDDELFRAAGAGGKTGAGEGRGHVCSIDAVASLLARAPALPKPGGRQPTPTPSRRLQAA